MQIPDDYLRWQDLCCPFNRVVEMRWFLQIQPSHRRDKKFEAVFRRGDEEQRVSFGARGYSDYLQHCDSERHQRYWDRHRAHENWEDPFTVGALSRWLLWGPTTSLDTNLRLFRRCFGFR